MVTKPNYTGNGIATTLWDMVDKEAEKLVWRCNPKNEKSADFYNKECDGLQKTEDWIVYWKNLQPEEIEEAVNYALSKKPTLIESDSHGP